MKVYQVPNSPLTRDILFLKFQSPVITLEEAGKTITLAESGAICEFLIDRFATTDSSLKPSVEDHEARAAYLYWLHFAEGTTMLPLMLTIVFNRIKKGKVITNNYMLETSNDLILCRLNDF